MKHDENPSFRVRWSRARCGDIAEAASAARLASDVERRGCACVLATAPRPLLAVLFAGLAILVGFYVVLYQAFPPIEPEHATAIFIVFGCSLAWVAIVWRGVLVRRSCSITTLYAIDLTHMIATGVVMSCAAFFAPELRAAGYASLIQTIFTVFTRAIVVPSTWRRTVVTSSLAVAPLIAASIGLALTAEQDLPGPAFVIGGLVLAIVAVVLATVGSRLIYELRRQVSEATQLGQYTLEQKIGEGGMGIVYLGHHVLLRRPTALKLLHPERVGVETLDRFEREVQHTSQLSHPNTVAVFDYGRSADGVFYYAMEYLDGIDLEQIVRRYGAQPADRVIAILVQVCGALQEAHDRGIVHRDIKPANIMLCEHGGVADVAKVVDFGLVKEIAQDVNETKEHVLGTPAYIAPEMVTSPRSVTHAADLYALGAVGYFLLAGRRVFEGTNVLDLCVQHVTAEPPPLPGISPALEAVISRCLRKKPHERYDSAAQLASELAAIKCGDWNDDAKLSWWKTHRSARSLVATASAQTKTITIDVGRRS